MPEMVRAVKSGKFGWFSGGHYKTSTTHVDNVVEGLLLAAEKAKPGEIYFISDGEPVEFRDFITKLLATQGVDAGSRSVPRWVARGLVALTSWMKHPPLTRMAFALMAHEVTIDDGKARRELGYIGNKTIEQGLAELR
jgi:nucleoside-diphosphate-sugar epimerase